MTFSCPHFDLEDGGCKRLKSECIPTRPGCVLRGKVKVGEDIEKRLKALEESSVGARQKKRKKRGRKGR